MAHCILNGRLLDASDATVSVQDRGFRFGDGVFETIAVEQGVPYQFEFHMARLQRGLNAIKIQYDTTQLKAQCRQLLHQNGTTDGLLRVQVTRGIGSKGYLPLPQASPTVVIETAPTPQLENQPVALWQSGYRKVPAHALPVQYKLCQGLNSTLARMEAMEQDCADALMLSEAGLICETSSGNIFWRMGKAVFTPSLACGILEGSTRAALLRLCPDIRETETTIETLLEADAVCITNAAWKALPVGLLKPSGASWDSEAFGRQYARMIADDRRDYCGRHRADWQ